MATLPPPSTATFPCVFTGVTVCGYR
jgi:hypothetical protein